MMFLNKRLREVDVPEMRQHHQRNARQTREYYRDMTRQLWDEARHAMMGDVGLPILAIDWSKKSWFNHTWSVALKYQLNPSNGMPCSTSSNRVDAQKRQAF